MFKHLRLHRYFYTTVAFIILCSASFNNLPYGDDNIYVFDNYLMDVPSIWDFWKPYNDYFKSWPLVHTVFAALLKTFGFEVLVYRFLNIGIHIANAFMFSALFRLWKPGAKQSEHYLLFTLFLIHPISFITFNWVFQLKTLLCMFFSLACLYCLERTKTKAYPWAGVALISFLLAINSKIACVLLPLYLLPQWKKFKNKGVFVAICATFFAASLYYGLVNLKGINSFFKERALSEKPITEYAQDVEKVKVVSGENDAESPQDFLPSNYYFVSFRNQLLDSAASLKNQFSAGEDIKQKLVLSMFTFGRYVNSSLGLNRYAIVYEPNWVSLSPGVIIPFVFCGFLFLWMFFDKSRWRELTLLLLFFIPVSGLFYVPYMKFSYIADHWFYMSLPFLLTLTIVNRPNILKLTVAGIIGIQFLSVCVDFTSTSKITKRSLDIYKNPFLISYMIEEAEKRHEYQDAYNLIDEYVAAKGGENENSIKTKLRLNLEHLKNDQLPGDLKRFIDYSIAKKDIHTALGFLGQFGHYLPQEQLALYQNLLAGLRKGL